MQEQVKKTLDDLVFEDRNKNYGAYHLRKIYPNHIRFALIAVAVGYIWAIGGPFVYIKFFKKSEPVVKEKTVEVDLRTIEIPPLDPSLPPPPPPPPVEKPKIKTVKHVPPKVVPDKEVIVEELPPVVDSLETAAIGNQNVEGEEDTTGLNQLEEIDSDQYGLGEEDDNLYIPAAGIHATFPGGDGEFQNYLKNKMKKTVDRAARLGDKGSVIVYFIVEKDGSISNVRVLKGLAICSTCNDEAKKVIESMPDWAPAKHNGKPVRVQYTLPIRFDFDD